MEKIPYMIVSSADLGEKYEKIDYGDEGVIYNYEDKYALKILTTNRLFSDEKEEFERKMAKIKELTKISDENCCFPKGLVGYLNYNMVGYYMDLVKTNIYTKDYFDLMCEYHPDKLLEYLIKADKVIERLHNKGFIIGDVKGDNILIDENNNPMFIDTDNYVYGDYGFDLIPDNAICLRLTYGNRNLRDNDIFVYAIMALNLLTKDKRFFCGQTDEGFEILINELPYSEEVKEYLRIIFSDSVNKPYLTPVLKKMKKCDNK